MNRERLLLGLASVLAGTTVLMAVLGVVYNLFFLVLAVPFGIGTYIIWGDATGRIETKARTRRARRRASADARRGRRQRAGRRRRTRTTDGGGRRSAPRAGSGPTAGEARRVLDVGPDAGEAEIKRAYRERVKEVHPDTAGGDEEAFKRATEAYERLVE